MKRRRLYRSSELFLKDARAGRERTLSRVGTSMEGTSGAAECASLRGETHEAALHGRASRKRGPARRACGCPSTMGTSSAAALQPPAETGARQEVPEPIGLGLSFRRERSRSEDAVRVTSKAPDP